MRYFVFRKPNNLITIMAISKKHNTPEVSVKSTEEQILDEFQKLANICRAITVEQKHLQDLYFVNLD